MNITINQNIINQDTADTSESVSENITLRSLLALLGNVQKAASTPTPKALREEKEPDGSTKEVKPLVEALGGNCKVYANGYAVYSKETGTSVVWIPECRSYTYNFAELTPKEKEYMEQKSTVDESVFDEQPWFMAVMVRGDHQVELNSMNRQFERKGSRCELREDDETEDKQAARKEQRWSGGYHFESPETAVIRKETLKEQLDGLTEKQREVFILHRYYGYAQYEIAAMLGITQQAVECRLSGARKKIRRSEKNL